MTDVGESLIVPCLTFTDYWEEQQLEHSMFFSFSQSSMEGLRERNYKKKICTNLDVAEITRPNTKENYKALETKINLDPDQRNIGGRHCDG